VDFTSESMATEPQLLHILAPNEAVVAIGVEVRIGDAVGMMNIALPSIVIKMMRQKFDQQWSMRKTRASENEQARVLKLLREAVISLEALLDGPAISVRDLLRLEEGQVLTFDFPVGRPIGLLANELRKFSVQAVTTGRRRACLIETVHAAPNQEIASGEKAGPEGVAAAAG
jgi:flagellar motor switch protein FliM